MLYIFNVLILCLTFFSFTNFLEGQTDKSKNPNVPYKLCNQRSILGSEIKIVASDNNEKNIIYIKGSRTLTSYDTERHSENWKTEIAGDFLKIIKGNEKELILIANSKLDDSQFVTVVSLSSLTGITNWHKEFNNFNFRDIAVANQYLVLTSDMAALFLNKNDGYMIFSKPESKIDKIIYTNGNSLLFINGTNLFESKLEQPFISSDIKLTSNYFPGISSAFSDGNRLIVGKDNGEILSFSEKEETPTWRFKSGAKISWLGSYNGKLIASSYDNFVYSLDKSSGNLKWKKRIGERINIDPFVNGNLMTVSSLTSDTVYVINLDDGKTINQVKLDEGNFITGQAIIFNDDLLLQTEKGILYYSQTGCK